MSGSESDSTDRLRPKAALILAAQALHDNSAWSLCSPWVLSRSTASAHGICIACSRKCWQPRLRRSRLERMGPVREHAPAGALEALAPSAAQCHVACHVKVWCGAPVLPPATCARQAALLVRAGRCASASGRRRFRVTHVLKVRNLERCSVNRPEIWVRLRQREVRKPHRGTQGRPRRPCRTSRKT